MFRNQEKRIVIRERMIILYDALQALLKLRISAHFSHILFFCHIVCFPFPWRILSRLVIEYFIFPMVHLVFLISSPSFPQFNPFAPHKHTPPWPNFIKLRMPGRSDAKPRNPKFKMSMRNWKRNNNA